jgi:hypothetical protein
MSPISALKPINILTFIAAVAVSSSALAAKDSTVPGTYHDWHDVDEVTIIQPFVAANYSQIAVESFDSGGVKLPPANENTHQAVLLALQRMKPAFIQGVGEKAKRKTSSNAPGKTLVIRARLTKVDPGSQAARFWVGFGAGAVKIAMIGEIVDAASGKVLVRFAQERRSSFGAFGSYGPLFERTARQLGGDVAEVINAF